MSRARHHEKHKEGHKKHHRDDGGRVGMRVSGNPDVFEEADERKRGGKVHKKKHVGEPEGKIAKHRMDRLHRPGRKMGGRVGADKHPLSSAHSSGKADEKAHGQPD